MLFVLLFLVENSNNLYLPLEPLYGGPMRLFLPF